jgi:16S rRNA (adenine1518-N6/adenine1519-N6)-dimethyltransferase
VTLTRREISDLLAQHGLRPSRALGQNFVIDANTVRRVARLSGVSSGDRVVEIGAGLGSLTLALVESGASVTAIEVDHGLVPLLRSIVEPAGATVVEADALALDWSSIVGTTPGSSVLVANLPYNVATPLVVRLLENVPAIGRMLVMVQLEAAERFAADPGDPAYGAVSVRIAYWANAVLVGRVPATVFHPRPNVESALVSITRRDAPAVDTALVSYERLSAVVRAGFAHRRKMLRRSLYGVVEPAAFAGAGVAPEDRAEQLDVHAWGRLAAWTPSSPTRS